MAWKSARSDRQRSRGFTLIELSIVLVIIGLIVGGILVGRDLIAAAAVRAQIAQIERFNQATNTFKGKYGALPGDMNSINAQRFNFPSRTSDVCGHGDENGLIEGNPNGGSTCYMGTQQGEPYMLWADLIASGFIANGAGMMGWYSDGGQPAIVSLTTSPAIGFYLPAASTPSNFVYVGNDGSSNIFGISRVSDLGGGGALYSTVGFTVAQAKAIDAKMDDGLPVTGGVTARYLSYALSSNSWTWLGPTDTTATAATPTTCYDNANTGGNMQQYSISQNNGMGINCALSFRFQ